MTDLDTLDAILAEFDVVPLSPGAHWDPLEPRPQTKAIGTLARLHRHHGPGHVRMVLRLMCETENRNNRTEFVAPWFQAVSRLVLAHPHWDDMSVWFDVMDRADLAAIRRLHSRNRRGAEIAHALAAHLFALLAVAFGDADPQMRLPMSEAAE